MEAKSSAVRGLRSCWIEDDDTHTHTHTQTYIYLDATSASVITMKCHLYISIILTITYATSEHAVAQLVEAYKLKGSGFNS
jgi:hypothetical protein